MSKILEIKNTVIKMKNAFDGFISTLDMAEERINEPEDMAIETSETEKEWEQRWKKEEKEGMFFILEFV